PGRTGSGVPLRSALRQDALDPGFHCVPGGAAGGPARRSVMLMVPACPESGFRVRAVRPGRWDEADSWQHVAMKVLRTPEDRFADLPDFGYLPGYGEVDGVRVAYVEAGPADGEPVLLLHGEPSWSFLYRKVMPVLAGAGLRAIAADLVGFGRSDKPAEVGDHSFARDGEWIRGLAFDHLDLRGLTVVGQDWGGLIGLRLGGGKPRPVGRGGAAHTRPAPR